MLHDVEAVFSVPAILTIIYGERPVTDHGAKRGAEAFDVEAVGRNRLPGKIAADAETANVAIERKLRS